MGFDLFLVYWLVMAGSSVSKLFKLTREAVINYKVGLVMEGGKEVLKLKDKMDITH